MKYNGVVVFIFTILVICLPLVIAGNFTYAIVTAKFTNRTVRDERDFTYAFVTAQATVTPTIFIYLPLISRQSTLIYSSTNLSGHSVVPECNPGNTTSCPCSDADVSIISSFDNYGEVTSNVRKVHTYVNAIGHKKFIETFPSGEAITLGGYTYKGQVNLPTLPFPDPNQIENPEAVHMMIQLWDGRNVLYQSNKETLEGTIYWYLNPWNTEEYGKIKVYTGKPLVLIDTGIKLTPVSTTDWHTFELVVDLKSQKYVSIMIDGETRDLSNFELARVSQPTWGDEVSLTITTESLAGWPQAGCVNVFSWTTRFRDLEFRRIP